MSGVLLSVLGAGGGPAYCVSEQRDMHRRARQFLYALFSRQPPKQLPHTQLILFLVFFFFVMFVFTLC